MDRECAAFTPAAFARVAQAADRASVAITGYAPVSVQAAANWLTTFRYARHAVSQPELTPLVAGITVSFAVEVCPSCQRTLSREVFCHRSLSVMVRLAMVIAMT